MTTNNIEIGGFMKSTFKLKILVIMLITIMVPIIFLTLFVTYNSETYYESFIPENNKANVQKDLSQIELFFVEKREAMESQSILLSLNESSEYIYNLLDHFIEKYPAFLNSYYTKEIGEDFANDYGETPNDGRTRDWYKEAVNNADFTISSPYIDSITGEYVTTLSIPVYNNGKLQGVFGVDFKLADIVKNTRELTRLNDVSYILEDDYGNIIYYDKQLYNDEKAVRDILDNIDESNQFILNDFYLPDIKLQLNIVFNSDEYQINKTKIGFEMSLLFIFVILTAILFAMRGAKKLSEPLNEFKKRIVRSEENYNENEVELVWDEEFSLLFNKFHELSTQISNDKLKLSRRVDELQNSNNELMEKNMALESIYKNLKQIDKKVRKSRNDYESILENVKGMIWVLDSEGKIVFVNQELLSHLNYKHDELVNKSIGNLIINSYEEHFDCLDLIKTRDFQSIELSLKNKNNENILVEANTSRINDDEGNIIYIYGICRNVRETKKIFYDYSVKIQEQNLMMDLTETASMNISMVQVIKVIFEKINSIFGWSVGSIRFLNENNEFELVAKTDVGSDYINPSTIPNEETCLSYIIETNTILYAKKIEDLPYFEDVYHQMIENGYVIIFIPVGNDDIGKGVISLVIDQVSMIEKEDILKSFTNTILLVVERALVYEKLKNDYIRMIKVLAEAGDDKDSSSVGHSNRVAYYAKKIGEHLYLDDDEIIDIEICGLLHDIGKIGISDEYLHGKDLKNIDKVKEHPIIGKRMLKDIGLAQSILEGIEMHHLNFDLSGYPKVEHVESLPLFARIIQVADGFDNLKENNSELTNLVVFEGMNKESGTTYCPQVMRVFKNIIESEKLKV